MNTLVQLLMRMPTKTATGTGTDGMSKNHKESDMDARLANSRRAYPRRRQGNEAAGLAHSAICETARSTRVGGAALALGLMLTLGQFSQAFAQEPSPEAIEREAKARIEALKRDVAKADTDLRRTDSLRRDEDQRHARLRAIRQEDMRRRNEELTELEGRLAEVRSRMQAERNRQAGLQNRIDDAAAREKALMELMLRQAATLAAQVQASLPHEREARLERIQALRRDLENGTSIPDEAFARLQALVREEIRFGDDIELVDRPIVRIDGRTINVSLLRIGNQGMLYADAEDRHYGILERNEAQGQVEWTWREELGFNERKMVRDAIDVRAARKPPQLAALPFLLSQAPEAEPREGVSDSDTASHGGTTKQGGNSTLNSQGGK